MKMNPSEIEIYNAVRKVQDGPVIIWHTCIICKEYLRHRDVHRGCAICWGCRRLYFPVPKVLEKKADLKKAILVQLKDGRYAILLS
jgi:hypothetical protein